MSTHREDKVRRLSAPDIFRRKGAEPPVALTAYTAPIAALLDEPCDLLLVGDSTGMVARVATLNTIESDDRVRAVALTGAGDRAFDSGADIGDLAGSMAASDLLEGMLR